MDLASGLVHIYTALAVLYADPSAKPEQPSLWCLTENVLYETSGEPIEGKLAVLEVVATRKDHAKYPDTYCGVVHQDSQFSWTLIEPEYRWKPKHWEIEGAAQLAYSFMLGDLPKTSVYGATHFINIKQATHMPDWYYRYEYMGKLGDHEFFRRPERGELAPKHLRKVKDNDS